MKILVRLPIQQYFAREILLGIRQFLIAFPRFGFEEVLEHHPDRPQSTEGATAVLGVLGSSSLQKRLRSRFPYGVNTTSGRLSKDFPNVIADDLAIGGAAARALLENGHERFAAMGSADLGFCARRIEGFRQTLEQSGHPLPACFLLSRNSRPSGMAEMQKWIGHLPEGTAVFRANDFLARHGILAARRAGLRVPGDRYFLGVDGDRLENESSPVPIASVIPDFFGIGFQAVESIVMQMRAGASVEAPPDCLLPPLRVDIKLSADRHFPAADPAERARRFVSEHLTDDLRVPALAHNLGLSERSLYRRFDKWFATTPPDYVRAQRVAEAKRLLETTTLPISLVAEKVGLNEKHFGSLFRRVCGQSPLACRRAANAK
ncbi:MAG: substrate-binding domain-containing protein [Opitutales bacterium]|nr:substrate-binding domain-containing protein [Opitutales bacterium]